MNCKPGDLVILTRCKHPSLQQFVGQIRQIGRRSEQFLDSWLFTPELRTPDGRRVSWRDVDMRPIRDPGDDAQDEMLRPLPQEVTA